SDVFSFGALLYRMCTGEFPFSGPTQVSTIAKILETAHAAPSGKNSAIPPELERIINKCLQKSADDRYQDTRDLVVDLRDLRKKFDSGVSDSISGDTTTAQAPKKHSRGQIAILSALGIMMVVFMVIAWLQDDDSPNSGSSSAIASEYAIAILDFENKSNNADLDWLEDGFPDILLTDLTETGALSVLSRERIFELFRREGIAGENSDGTYSRQQMRDACKTLGASSIISGSFFKIGDKIRIDARMEHVADGKTLWSQKVVGEDLFSLVDSLTDKVAVALNITDIMPSRGNVSEVMTFSPEAYRLYHEGMKQFRLELYEEARSSFKEALEIDSTFALPNMRIGMSYSFANKRVEAAKYFKRASAFKSKLPVRERSLLDAYLDVFLRQQFASGFAKIEAFVANYPDDKEVRTVFGLLENVANGDTAAAFEQYRIVLDQDPGFQFALAQSINLLQQNDRYEEAIALTKQLQKFHPESPEPYREFIDSYNALGKISLAIEAAHTTLKHFPQHAGPLSDLARLFVKQRMFDSARHYLELYKLDDTTDSAKWATYHFRRASLAMWSGQFHEATRHFHKRLEVVIASEDVDRIESSYRVLASHFSSIGMQDSMIYYAQATTRQNTVAFQEVSYPLMMINRAYEEGVKLRALFDSLEIAMRSQLPPGMWLLVESMNDIYYGYFEHDTARALRGFIAMNTDQRFRQGGNILQTGSLQIDLGLYQDALDDLTPLLSGKMELTNGYSAPLLYYLMGRAHEGLGNTDKAIEFYREVLKYWGTPDIEIKEIRQTRERLARLTS
ncbi:tetratricopeptide repeat protein, partial [Gemmatimonas aurantiaca]|nr:tetratricopeptide repeat protein [Gemmatimonas aurantiaca]